MSNPQKWTGEAVKLMHLNRITQRDVAEKMGLSRERVCKILNGDGCTETAKSRIMNAIFEIIESKKSR